MQLLATLALILGGFGATLQLVLALGQGDAEAMYDAFNNAFLTTSGSSVFYKKALNDTTPDGTWAASLDILGTEDAYERTGDPDKKEINQRFVDNLAELHPNTVGLGRMERRYWLITGNQTFLETAQYGFDYAFGRGWDTQYNDGGMWEQNPSYMPPGIKANKCALSNNSLGKAACLIYQSTLDVDYLNKCRQLYNWASTTIYNSTTGEVYPTVEQDGTIIHSPQAYNQGTFLDYANLVWEITGDSSVYNDAKLAIDFGRDSITVNGIFGDSGHTSNTWADEMARGVGHFVAHNNLWGTYYSWMVQNADAILENRRTDLGITWNAWNEPTPDEDWFIPNYFVSAMAWLQYTPATQPNNVGGIHVITNQQTGMAFGSAGTYGNSTLAKDTNITQWDQDSSLNQRWVLTQNSDASWILINHSTWLALDCPGGSDEEGLGMIQWPTHRNSNQRWSLDQQSNGNYKIPNQATGKVLDGGSSAVNGTALIQSTWNGQAGQLWSLSG